jgi:hypothetical protein
MTRGSVTQTARRVALVLTVADLRARFAGAQADVP